MKVLFWTPYPTQGPSNRYRVEQYLPSLRDRGIDFDLRPFWSSAAYKLLYEQGHFLEKTYYFLLGVLSRLRDILAISKYHIVFIHREACPVGGAFFETVLSLLRKPIIFDFDDAIFLPSGTLTNSFIERFKRPDKTSTIIRKSSHVISGNSYLYEYALRYNNSVSVIPTPIDTARYAPMPKESQGDITIGWAGSITTLEFLKMLENVFIKLSRHFPFIKIKTIGGYLSVKELTNITSKKWSLEEELDDLRAFDIGVMPMPDNEWTRGKCGFKAILYMSMGIPCVCSPVGMNKDIITDAKDGFFASSEEEWFEKLSLLITDAGLRKRIGIAARETVEKTFSVKVNAPKFTDILLNVYANAYDKGKRCAE